MSSYFKAVGEELRDWKKAVLVVILTVARLIYGIDWLKAGIEKLPWLSNGKTNSAGMIHGMIKAVTHSHGSDPLHLNNLLVWAAQHIFLGMPHVTDALVVIFEIGVGVFVILGIRIIITLIVAMFLNTQYAAAGAANNFGYIWTNLIFMWLNKYVGLIGVDGYLRHRKGKKLL